MSSQPPPETTAVDEEGMDIDRQRHHHQPPASISPDHNLAVVIRDSTDWLSSIRVLRETDIIILLTPVVIPISKDPTDVSDPFETLGRSIAKRHARVRHVPYTQRNGITSTHLGFIKRGHVIVLVFVTRPGQQIQLEFADIAFAVSENKPCIIVICCSPLESHHTIPFPTLIQTKGYTPQALEAASALIFGENGEQPYSQRQLTPRADFSSLPRLWTVEQWNEARDIAAVMELWTRNVSPKFYLDSGAFAAILRRPGYAKHYVVRDPGSKDVLGFCATYLSYVDQEGEKLIASLAILLVRAENREQGIGTSLHSHAVSQLTKTRGVMRLQFGSTFPRILYGPPMDMQIDEKWFLHKGWQLNKVLPGQGQPIYDMILDFTNWRHVSEEMAAKLPIFRPCTQQDMIHVLAMVEDVSIHQGKMGWFDQYSSLMNGPNVKDIILGIDENKIVAAALTYTPSCGSQIASNLPWASRLGRDVGGVTCVCILPYGKQGTIIGLLDCCVRNLLSQGMKKMFLDGVPDGVEELKQLGFEEWAKYRDVWRDT